MLKILNPGPMPGWLASWRSDSPFVAKEILAGSVYYPSSGLDYTPVVSFGGYSYSFVYVDYGIHKERVEQAFHGGFAGYRLLGCNELDMGELEGPVPWAPIEIDRQIDGDPSYRTDCRKSPFALWGVYERVSPGLAGHRPERFSVLYVCGDGAAVYQALYYSNSACPKAIALISPGEGFGHNWTNFFDPRRVFARSVRMNPAGTPEYLMTAGNGACAGERIVKWPDYARLAYTRKASIGWVELWC